MNWKFYENVYSYFLNKCIRCFLDNIFCPEPKVSFVSKKIIYFWFPFTGQHSLQLRNQIRKLCSSAFIFPSGFYYRPSLRLSHFFPFKDRAPKGIRSRVVYRFKCKCCSALYVGQTSRHLHARICDHLGISALMGKKRINLALTSIPIHHHDTCHPISPGDFTILSSSPSSSSYDLLITESLLIKKLNPTLNSYISSIPLSLLWHLYLSSSPLTSFHLLIPLKCQIILINLQ